MLNKTLARVLKRTYTYLTKITFLFLMVAFLSSCVSFTKFTVAPGGCQQIFKTGEKMLMAEIEGISAYQSSLLYQKLVQRISLAGLQPAYAAAEDMNLRLHQITTNADSVNLDRMHQQLNFEYYLKIQLLDSKSGEVYGTFSKETVEAKQANLLPLDDEEPEYTHAVVQLLLYSTSAKKLIYKLTTTTEMHPVTFPKKDGGEHFVNASDSGRALTKAIHKSTKKMLKGCYCCL